MTTIVDQQERRALKSADAIMVENDWMFDYAQAVNGERRPIIRFVPPGVDADRFSPLPHRNLRADPYILCVGRLDDERKNIALVLRAFAALPADLLRTRLVLAGWAGPSKGFWRLAEGLGVRTRISMVESPTSEELVSLYRSASVFALSSDEEGFGIVLIEAMACGVPVVSTRCGGPDGIVRDGKEGYLTGVGDTAEFTDRLTRLLSSERLNRTMGDAARRTVLERFDSRVAGAALLNTYDELLDVRRLADLSA